MAEDTDYALIPPEGDPDVGKKVFEVLAKVIADKTALGLHERWLRNHQLRRNQHWKAKSPAGVPLSSANMIFTHTQRTVNTLTDNEPTFNVAAVGGSEEQDKDQLSDLQRTTEHWWRDQEQQDIFESCVLNGEMYGVTIAKSAFNPDLEYNLGEVETLPVNPRHFGWYPTKLAYIRDLQKCEALLHFYPVTVRELKAKHPAKAKEIKPDDEIIKELNEDEHRGVTEEGAGSKGSVMTSISDTVRKLLNFLNGSTEINEDETIRCEMWLRDNTTVTREVEGINITEPKYTGGIRYILVCSGNVVLEDKDNPNINPTLTEDQARLTYLYDKFPFAGANSIKDTSNAWGFSDIEEGESLNMEVNKALSQFVVEKDRSARKKLINPLDTGVPNEAFTNYVGIINPTSTMVAQGIKWLETPPAGVDYEKAIAIFKDFFFLVMGSFELDQAQTAGRDVIAYKAIAALLERAATMMRGKIRSYSRLIREIGRMAVSGFQNFYTEDRWITYKGDDGKQASKAVNGARLIMPAKLTVVSGSTMPVSRIFQREEAIALFSANGNDLQALHEALDTPNRDALIKRMMAGPLGAVLEKLMTAQVPEPILDYLKAIVEIDPKDLKRELEKGTFPPFMAFMQKLMAEMEGQPGEGPDPAAVAEVKKLEAEIAKTLAERDLTTEKIVSERVTQNVKMAGVSFDEETIKMNRAKIVNDMENAAATHHHEGVKTGLDFVSKAVSATSAQNNRPGYNEKSGIKSNNVEQ